MQSSAFAKDKARLESLGLKLNYKKTCVDVFTSAVQAMLLVGYNLLPLNQFPKTLSGLPT